MCGKGSAVKCVLSLHIDGDELDRLSGLDFATYDDEPVAKLVDGRRKRNAYITAKSAFAEEFLIKMAVSASVVADLR